MRTLLAYRLLRSASYEEPMILGPFPMYIVFNGLLLVLQLLHIFWFMTILRMCNQYLQTGKVIIVGDVIVVGRYFGVQFSLSKCTVQCVAVCVTPPILLTTNKRD